MDIKIKKIETHEIEEGIEVVRKTFDKFVGIDYSEEGKGTFNNFVEKEKILERLKKGNLIIRAKVNDRVVGILEIKDKSHIALFFVDEKYQKRGIGKKIFKYALKETNNENKEVTVNSSIFAEKIYKALGFEKISELEEKNGIKYIPMRYKIGK